MARYVAKNVVAAGLADKCFLQLAYVIGVKDPVSIMIDTYHTGKISNENLLKLIRENFDLTPQGIIKSLDLHRPIYRKTAAYGHFGREEKEFTWEMTDMAAELKRKAKNL
jgi:S-adenosylmethionine synthetase